MRDIESIRENPSVSVASAQFELVSPDLALGTSKLYARGDFLPYGDPAATDEGDFVGRLRALFGPVEGDAYALRHRDSGIVVTAYVDATGPVYGGGSNIDPDLSPQEAAAFLGQFLQDTQRRLSRVSGDPELAAGPPSQRPENSHLRGAERAALRELDHAWQRRLADANAPEDVAKVVAELDTLINQATPADWETTRYYGDLPSVYRIGARGGQGYVTELGTAEALALLADLAERDDHSLVDAAGSPFDDPNLRVVQYFVATKRSLEEEDELEEDELDEDEPDEDLDGEDEEDELGAVEDLDDEDDDDELEDPVETLAALEAALPRVQAAWFRSVEKFSTFSPEVRAGLVELAREQIADLGLDVRKADLALTAALGG